MKIRILLASLFVAGISVTGFSQDDQQQMGVTEQDAQARLEGSEQLQSQYDAYKAEKQELFSRSCEVLNQANIDLNSDQPVDFQYEQGDLELSIEKEQDGDVLHNIEDSHGDWKYKKEGDEIKEKFEGNNLEYQYEKEGAEVKEKINGADVEYLFEESPDAVKEHYKGPNNEWTYEKKANGEATIEFKDDVEEYKFEKNQEGQTSIDYKMESDSESLRVQENFDGSGKIEYESDDLQNSELRQQIDLKKRVKTDAKM